MQELDKKYYKIGDVAQILGIPESTLRYWETQFTIVKPRRNAKNIRFYTPNDIEIIRKIHYLVKEKGLKLDAAQAQLRANRDGVDKRFEVVDRLKDIKAQLQQLQQIHLHMQQQQQSQGQHSHQQSSGPQPPVSPLRTSGHMLQPQVSV